MSFVLYESGDPCDRISPKKLCHDELAGNCEFFFDYGAGKILYFFFYEKYAILSVR